MHLEHHLVGGYVRYISPHIIIIIIIILFLSTAEHTENTSNNKTKMVADRS